MVKYSSLGGMAQLVEHSLHMRGVTGSSPVVSTTLYQSAPVADWFFIFLDFFVQNVNDFIVFSEKHNLSYFEIVQPNLSAHKVSILHLSQSLRVLLPFVAAF